MTKNELKVLMMNIVGGMDTLVRQINNEELIEPWLAEGVPDGVEEGDLEWFAEDDWNFSELADLFAKVIDSAVRDGGFYTGD